MDANAITLGEVAALISLVVVLAKGADLLSAWLIAPRKQLEVKHSSDMATVNERLSKVEREVQALSDKTNQLEASFNSLHQDTNFLLKITSCILEDLNSKVNVNHDRNNKLLEEVRSYVFKD